MTMHKGVNVRQEFKPTQILHTILYNEEYILHDFKKYSDWLLEQLQHLKTQATLLKDDGKGFYFNQIPILGVIDETLTSPSLNGYLDQAISFLERNTTNLSPKLSNYLIKSKEQIRLDKIDFVRNSLSLNKPIRELAVGNLNNEILYKVELKYIYITPRLPENFDNLGDLILNGIMTLNDSLKIHARYTFDKMKDKPFPFVDNLSFYDFSEKVINALAIYSLKNDKPKLFSYCVRKFNTGIQYALFNLVGQITYVKYVSPTTWKTEINDDIEHYKKAIEKPTSLNWLVDNNKLAVLIHALIKANYIGTGDASPNETKIYNAFQSIFPNANPKHTKSLVFRARNSLKNKPSDILKEMFDEAINTLRDEEKIARKEKRRKG